MGAYCHPRLDSHKDVDLPEEEEAEVEAEIDPFEEDERLVELPQEEEVDDEQRAMNERYKALYKDVGDDIDYQTLHFVVPMKSRTAKEVRSRTQQIYLQLRQQGLPLVRIHSDRGRELMAKETRAWMTGTS